jgi:hypothetical protein
MSKQLASLFAITILSLSDVACGAAAPPDEARADDAIAHVYPGQLTIADAQTACRCRLELVPVGGTVFHFGLDVAQSPPVPYPFPLGNARLARGATLNRQHTWAACVTPVCRAGLTAPWCRRRGPAATTWPRARPRTREHGRSRVATGRRRERAHACRDA